MAAEIQAPESSTSRVTNRRNPKHRNMKKFNKKQRPLQAPSGKAPKPSMKMQKLFRKRAREYNSSDEEDEGEGEGEGEDDVDPAAEDQAEDQADDASRDPNIADSGDEIEENDGAHVGITKLSEGSRAFKLAFSKILKQKLAKDPLGPVLSAAKKLVAEKLAEEVTEHKGKAEAKKQKLLAQEKGHVKIESFLDSKEKYLISVATKGVVKLFNAVSKAHNPQKGLNPSKSKDAKVLAKQRRQTFLSELKKSTGEAVDNSHFKVPNAANRENEDEPGWAPLRDSYMLTSSKLKDWDKMTDTTIVDQDKILMGSSSDEE